MEFPTKYSCLVSNEINENEFAIIPIRYQDRYKIMEWRNEQMIHLRQNKKLTKADQDEYFNKFIHPLFTVKKPDQILFSFLEHGQFIGYGGLVHINWVHKNAEVSFLLDTKFLGDDLKNYWLVFLRLIGNVAFNDMLLHKIYTYAYDIRPYLYDFFEKAGFVKEAVLKDQCFIENSFRDVIIHSKICTHEQ